MKQILLLLTLSLLSQQVSHSREPFEPSLESLQGYECPEWFRDAKFGIYVHWGVYSVAEMGEWYGREMYIEGDEVYDYHLENYGHPSEFGYKDLIPLWKAERFDPDAWMRLFKEAGARYFTPCATHHDSFDLWDSSHHTYNAVKMGPRKDLLGMMRTAALEHGLRFGVTTHFGRSISWMQTSHGSDTNGPYAGVPYDGNDPAYQDLYMVPYSDSNRADTENPPVMWREWWLLRMQDLIAKYHPDLIYLDSAVPFAGEDNGGTGMRLFADFYNDSMKRHDGRLEGVMTHKGDKGPKRAPFFPGIATLDKERNRSGNIREEPWQTDDSIGPWGYRKGQPYKTPDAVIDKMIDIVSKNGNLLLNVPPKADGTLDPETVDLLKAIGAWFRINGEGIYATRPWHVYGEGPDTKMGNRALVSPFTHENVRYTRSKDGQTLFAILLGTPDPGHLITLTELGKNAAEGPYSIGAVSMLGSDAKIEWDHAAEGLQITAPSEVPNDLAVIFKIEFNRNNSVGNRR